MGILESANKIKLSERPPESFAGKAVDSHENSEIRIKDCREQFSAGGRGVPDHRLLGRTDCAAQQQVPIPSLGVR